jgi:hypothetical protein
MTKASVLLCAFLIACGNPDDILAIDDSDASDQDPQALEGQLSQLVRDAIDDDPATSRVPFERAMQDCYVEARARGPLEVHTMGRYLALGDTMMLVRVTIPKAPELARCIEDAVMHEAPPGWARAPDSLASGSFAIDLGGPARDVRLDDIAQQYDEHVKGMAALMREVVERGLLPADHRLVHEALAAEAEITRRAEGR